MIDIRGQIIAYNKSPRSYPPKFIVVHDTGDPGASAQNEHDYFSGGSRGASADFFVDSNNIIQIVDTDNFYSWHCGDGNGAYGITNANSLGIEMCLEDDGYPSDSTVDNTIDLVRYLMDKYNIGIGNVVRHYDASRKCCPCSFSANNWARWYDFKNRVSSGAVSGQWIFDSKLCKWWYKHSDGSYTKDSWEKVDNKWYLFDAEGWMLYDWKLDGDKWYYLGNPNDGVMKTGWILLGDKWYYFGGENDGAMKIGWQKIDEKWYYFNLSGEMQTGWIKDDGKDYCLYSNGAMISNCDMYGYRFDSHGVATKLS
jgi:N-acetylmuramoyl-L-alanine amidase